MSSHHVVRDEQEPALLLLTDQLSTELINNLLEWSPTVIIDAQLAKNISLHTFKVDVVIGIQKELDEAKLELSHQEPIKYLSKSENDDTLLQALYFLSSSNYKAVNVLGEFNRKVIEKIGLWIPKITIVFYEQEYKWYCVNDVLFKKWLPKGQKIKLTEPLTPKLVKNIKSEGNYWVAENDGLVEFEMSESNYWLGEAI